jgi:hypothetical protein
MKSKHVVSIVPASHVWEQGSFIQFSLEEQEVNKKHRFVKSFLRTGIEYTKCNELADDGPQV